MGLVGESLFFNYHVAAWLWHIGNEKKGIFSFTSCICMKKLDHSTRLAGCSYKVKLTISRMCVCVCVSVFVRRTSEPGKIRKGFKCTLVHNLKSCPSLYHSS